MDNDGKIEICAAPINDEELRRKVNAANERVKMLLDELKKVFAPHMLLTFFVRDPNDPACFSLLTEEKDLQAIIDHLSNMPHPKPIPFTASGNA